MAKYGRPPKYKSADEMQAVIDNYFRECKGRLLRDKEGKPELDKNDNPIFLDAKPPTVTGLALALGFASRQALLNYQARSKEFNDALTRAKTRIEEYAESRLYDRDGVRGAMFNLRNNFKGWDESSQQTDSSINNNLLDVLKRSAKEQNNAVGNAEP